MTHNCKGCNLHFESYEEKMEHMRMHHYNHHHEIMDLGEPKGFYFGTKEKKRTGFGEIDYDFGLKL